MTETETPRIEKKVLGSYEWPFIAKLHSERKFISLIGSLIKRVKRHPTVPRGCFDEEGHQVYLIDEKLYDKIISELKELEYIRRRDAAMAKLDEEGIDYDWRTVVTTMQEALR